MREYVVHRTPYMLVDLSVPAGCRKGKRDCVYPEPPQAKSTAGQSSKESASSSRQGSPDEDDDEDEDEMEEDSKLETIPDEGVAHAEMSSQTSSSSSKPLSALHRARTKSSLSLHRPGSETPSSPSASTVTTSSLTASTYQFPEFQTRPTASQPEWAHLPLDLRFYLRYFSEHITHYHYGTVNDSHGFFASLPFLAVKHEALLYAVVGFAAYHHTLRDPQGRISQFLRFYNKSVTVLLNSLKRKEKHSLETLLTILQLATIEVRRFAGRPQQLSPVIPPLQRLSANLKTRSFLGTGST